MKSTRARKSKAPAIGEPEMISTSTPRNCSTSAWAMVRQRRRWPRPNVSWLYIRMRRPGRRRWLSGPPPTMGRADAAWPWPPPFMSIFIRLRSRSVEECTPRPGGGKSAGRVPGACVTRNDRRADLLVRLQTFHTADPEVRAPWRICKMAWNDTGTRQHRFRNAAATAMFRAGTFSFCCFETKPVRSRRLRSQLFCPHRHDFVQSGFCMFLRASGYWPPKATPGGQFFASVTSSQRGPRRKVS